jgi:hypothetical protein
VAADGPGATITTTPEGAAPVTQRVIVDNATRPITDGSCTGTEQAEWADDGYRLYSRASLTCSGGERRQVSGLSMFTPDGTWIEAQAIEIGARSSVRVRRFTRDGGAPATPARGRLTIGQVIDASRHVAAPALEAALVEARATFGLRRESLVALDAAGVPPSVIDVMVALTYPQAFTIHPAARADRLTAFPFEPDPLDPGSFWPGEPAPLAGYFDSAYFWSPFGYSAFGAYPVFFGNGGAASERSGSRSRPVNHGRVINGLGYTRLAPRGAEEARSKGESTAGGVTTTAGGSVSSRGYTRAEGGASGAGSSTAAGSTGASSTSGSSTGASSTAASSGGASGAGSGGGGRTAVDR